MTQKWTTLGNTITLLNYVAVFKTFGRHRIEIIAFVPFELVLIGRINDLSPVYIDEAFSLPFLNR